MTQQMYENFQEHRSHVTRSSMIKSTSSFSEALAITPRPVPNRFFSAHVVRSASSAITNKKCTRIENIEKQHEKSPSSRLRVKSALSEPWQKIYDGEQKTLISTANYTLMKNNQAYSAIIKNDFFKPREDENKNKADEKTKKSNLPPFIQEYINKLISQVDDLQVFLEEERLAHKYTKQQSQEYLKEQLLAQMNKYEALLQTLKEQHAKDSENTRYKLLQEFNEEKVKYDLEEQKLKADLTLLQGSFHSYKVNIQAEYESMFKKKEQELIEKYDTESKEAIRQVTAKLNREREKEKRELILKQKQEFEKMRKEEMERLENEELDKLSMGVSAEHKKKLDETIRELQECQLEIEDLKHLNVKLENKLKQTESSLNETRKEYDELKMNFDNKIKSIEQMYKDDIDNLVKDKVNITNLYMKKCEELYSERQLITGKLIENAQMTKNMLKKKLINTRNNARVSIAASVPSSNQIPVQKSRRSSVPSTEIEIVQAQLSAGNLDNLMKTRKKKFINGTPRVTIDESNLLNLKKN